MANYANLKAAINDVIKANGVGAITGTLLNQVLTAMVNSLGAGYQFMGVATPSTNPGTPDQNVFYFATQAGVYTNFDAIILQAGISVLMWDGDWASQTWFTIDSTPINNSPNLIASGAVFNALKLDGGAYDVTAHNSDATFASLSELLNSANLNTLIPTEIRHGGMSIKFVQSSDNKYVQFRYMSYSTAVANFTNVANWQGVDDGPVAGSKNLVENKGILKAGRVFVFKEGAKTQNISGIIKGHTYKLYIIGNGNFTSNDFAEFGYRDSNNQYIILYSNSNFLDNNFLSINISNDIYYDNIELFIYANVQNGKVVTFVLEDVTNEALNTNYELTGADSQIQWLPYYIPVLAGHKYRMYLLNKDIPVDNVTGYSILNFVVYNSAGTEITPRPVEVLLNTPLNDYYDIDVPANTAYARISMRANKGEKQMFFIQDITLLSSMSDDILGIRNDLGNNENVQVNINLDYTEREAIDGSSGNIFTSTKNKCTQYINVEEAVSVRFLGTLNPAVTSDTGYSFYTDQTTNHPLGYSKCDVGDTTESNVKEYVLSIPNGAKYFRFSVPNSPTSTPYCIVTQKLSAFEKIGDLNDLNSKDKTSLVGAINSLIDNEIKVTPIPMMLGYTNDGFTIKGTANERWDRSYSKLIKVNGEILEIPSEGSARVFIFDKDFNFISPYTTDLDRINQAAYIRCIRNENNADFSADFIIKHTGSLELINEPYLANNTFAPRWFTVDVAYPLDNPTTAWDNREKLYTNAWISLPWNYKQSGKKSKLIVYALGTSGNKWDTIIDSVSERVNFFNAMGYAVVCVNANTNKYKEYYRNNAATPLGVACFVAAVKYVISNYNIDDEIYVYGKSDGGMTTMNLINNSNLNIKAAAIHCPNLDVFNQFRCLPMATNYQQAQLVQFNVSVAAWDSAAITELKTKQDNFDGFSPITTKSTVNKKDYNDYVLDHNYPFSAGSYPNSGMKNYSDTYLMGQDMQNIVKDAKLFLNIPIKIWYAEDDEQVPYGTIVNFAKMASNAGCVCKLRKFADGTGGHGCADAWSQSPVFNLASRVSIQTRLGGIMDMPLGIVEALQWLELW